MKGKKGERDSHLHDRVCCVHESPNCELQGSHHGDKPQVGARPNLTIGTGDADVAESISRPHISRPGPGDCQVKVLCTRAAWFCRCILPASLILHRGWGQAIG